MQQTPQQQLSDLYDRAQGTMVAFIDESYRAPSQAIGGGSFYLLTAVLFPRAHLDAIRTSLETLSGGGRWHTTDEAQTELGRERIIKMSAQIAKCGAVVVAIQDSIPAGDKNAEAARERCFEVLLSQLCGSGSLDPDGLVVFERRRDSHQRNSDNATIRSLRREGRIPQSLLVHPASPADETLLYAPDIAAWALRRAHTHDESQFIDPIAKTELHRLKAKP